MKASKGKVIDRDALTPELRNQHCRRILEAILKEIDAIFEELDAIDSDLAETLKPRIDDLGRRLEKAMIAL